MKFLPQRIHNSFFRILGRFGLLLLALCLPAPLLAQFTLVPTIQTVVGTGTSGYSGDGGPGTSARIYYTINMGLDSAGNLYLADRSNNVIRKLTVSTGIITTVAGTGSASYTGDGGPATSATLNSPFGVAVDSAGNLYIADTYNNSIRKVTASTGVITTIAGVGLAGTTGDGGQATAARLNSPTDVRLDSAGNVYIAETNANRIRKITVSTGIITTFAGTGTSGYSGDGNLATSATLSTPRGIFLDSANNLYITDSGNSVIRMVNASTGKISTIAGTGAPGYSGDGGPATSATLRYPNGVAVDSAGNIDIADTNNSVIRQVNSTGTISTLTGQGYAGYAGDGGPAANAVLSSPYGVIPDNKGNLYISDTNNLRIRVINSVLKLNQTASFPTTAIGSSAAVQNVLVQTVSNMYIAAISVPASQGNQQEYSVGTVTGCTVDPTGSTATASGSTCTIPITFSPAYPGWRTQPLQIKVKSGSSYVTYSVGLTGIGTGPQAVVTPGIITTVAGTLLTPGSSGDGGPATSALLYNPQGIRMDAAGNTYIADSGNCRIRKVDTSGTITTVAGSSCGFAGDGGLATAAQLSTPSDVAIDPSGNLYIADNGNCRIRKADAVTGIIISVAGNGNCTYSGDGGQASASTLSYPRALDFDASGNLYIGDTSNNAIRKIAAATGVITTVAGTGLQGYTGDGGQATSATLYNPRGVAVDRTHNLLYIADLSNYAIRRVNLTTGVISTAAGTGSSGFSGDGGLATNAMLYQPISVSCDGAGNLYISDTYNYRIRRVDFATGIITTIAGVGSSTSTGSGIAATSAGIQPRGLAVDSLGNVYLGDYGYALRKVSTGSGLLTWPTATAINTTDNTDGPKTAYLTNSGNADLHLPPPSSGQNPSLSTNFFWTSASTCPQLSSSSSTATLASGTSCSIALNFTPTAIGSISGSAIATDDSLSVASTQTINLTGTGIAEKPTLSVSPVSVVYKTASATLTASLGYSGLNPTPTGTVIFKVDSGSTVTATCVTSSSTSSTCTATYTASTLIAGTHTISASLTADSYYQAVNATGTLTVTQAVPTITWATPASITYGTALSATQLNATASTTGSFSYSPAAGTVLSAGPHVLTVTFTPTDTTDYTSTTASVAISVTQVTPTITWPTPTAITYGTPLSAAQLNATASVGGTYVYSPAAGAVLNAGTQTLSVTFTPTDTTNYATATATVSLVINRATPTITWPTPLAITYGTALSATQLNATSSVAGSFVYTPSAGVILSAGTQTLSVTFLPTDSSNYQSTTATVALVVNKALPTISWATPTAITYGTALSAAQLNASVGIGGTYAYTPAAGTVLNAGARTLSVTFTPTDTTDYTNATATVTLTVNQATPTITWATPAAITYGNALSATQLNASASVAGSFAYTPAAGTVLSVGSHVLTATFSPTDATNYTTATATVSLTVNQATPTITWATPSAINYGTALGASQLNATASVPGSFTYSPAAGAVLSAGSHTLSVTFTPTDSTNYTNATATVTLVVNTVTPTITWTTPAAITYGTPLSATQLNASTTVAGTFTYSPATGTVLSAGTQVLSVTFTPTDTTNYNTATASVSLLVKQATPTITWATPASITYGTALSATQLDASASVPGTLLYSPAAGTVPNAGTQTLTVTFTPTDTTDYSVATASVLLTVTQGTPTLSWTPPAAISYGTALSPVQLDATASIPGTFAYSPATGTVLAAGTHTLTATFTPTDTVNYSTATVNTTVTVNQATPTITWAAPQSITYGTALSSTQLNASANTQGTFTYTPAIGTVLAAGAQTLSVTFTPNDTTNYGNATASVTLVVGKATPAIAWAASSAITYGTALSVTQLNATASVPGTFTYSPGGGSVLAAGTQTLTATFTPNDTNNYNTATASTSLTVLAAQPTITWPAPASIPAGTALSSTQLNATANVPGTFAYSPAAGTVLAAGTHTLSVTFTPTSNNYSTSTTTTAITVTQATATITWATPAAIPYGTALGAAQLNASASVPGTFSYSPAAGAVLTAGTHLLSVTFTPTDTASYASSTATVSLSVLLGSPTITWPTPAAISYGTALGTAQLNATASVPGSFFYTPNSGTVLGAGTQSLTVTFVPTDTVNYTSSSSTVGLTINQANTVTTVLSSTTTTVASGAVTLVASVGPVSGYGTPSGTVTFYDGTASITTVPLVGGTASASVTTLSAGATHSITATYSGDANFLTSTSSSTSVAVGTADFTFQTTGLNDQLVTSSNTATYTFVVTPTYNTYPASVSFSITGLPGNVTGTFSPTTIASTAGVQTITLTVKKSGSAALRMMPFFGAEGKGVIALALLLPFGLYRRRKAWARWTASLLLLFGLAGLSAGLSGCGTSSPGQSSILVTATSGSITHAVKVGLTVE